MAAEVTHAGEKHEAFQKRFEEASKAARLKATCGGVVQGSVLGLEEDVSTSGIAPKDKTALPLKELSV